MANYEQDEDADIALQKILEALQQKFDNFFKFEEEEEKPP